MIGDFLNGVAGMLPPPKPKVSDADIERVQMIRKVAKFQDAHAPGQDFRWHPETVLWLCSVALRALGVER